MSKALQIIQKTLVAKGHSQTKPRRQVLEVFFHNDKPLTPAAVRKQLPDRNINLASVYRAIELFCRERVLTEVDQFRKVGATNCRMSIEIITTISYVAAVARQKTLRTAKWMIWKN